MDILRKEPTLKEMTDIDCFAKNLSTLDANKQDIIIATCNGLVEGMKLSMCMKEVTTDGV